MATKRTPQQRLNTPLGGWERCIKAATKPRLKRGKVSQAHLAQHRAPVSVLQAAPRCTVVALSTGKRCNVAAVRGAQRCHWHGGLLEVPDHPGNRKRTTKYLARQARAKARDQAYLLPKHARDQAARMARASGIRCWHIILAGTLALLAEDGGLSLRRWMAEHGIGG